MGFVHAALLAGTLLAAVPLVIHLLNRQRHRPTPWAAMRFVLAAWRRTRRRVQMENLLLLLLRMAAVALIALAVARPFSGELGPLAALTQSRRDVVLLVDASASMGWREGVETSFERAVAGARELTLELDAGRDDRVRLFLCAAQPRLLSWTTPDQALSMLDALGEPADEPLDLAAAIAEVVRLAREESETAGQSLMEVHLYTDLQRRVFEPEIASGDAAAAPARPALFTELDHLREQGVRVLVEDVGPAASRPANLGVVALETHSDVLVTGTTVEVAVQVANHGSASKAGVRVALVVDGDRLPSRAVDVPARGLAEAVFPVTFTRSGDHVLVAELEGDRLTVDDTRAHVLRVPDGLRVLLVDGAPSSAIEEAALGLVGAVLEPPIDGDLVLQSAAPFDPIRVEPSFLATSDARSLPADVIWLADVDRLPEAAVLELERRVAAGAGLIVSLGPRVDVASFDAGLFRADHSGLAPAELLGRRAVASRRDSYWRVKSFVEDHPALSFFTDERWRMLLTEVPIYEFVAARPVPGAQVLAWLDDETSAPLLVERAFDRGRVLLWTTTFDPSWTRLAESPRTLVPLVHELVRHAAGRHEPPRNVVPGDALWAEVEAFPRSLALVRPDGARRAIDGEPTDLGGGRRWSLPPVDGQHTDRAGVYRIEIEGAPPALFAVRLDPREGDLDRLAPAELARLHPALVVFADGGDAAGGAEDPPARRGELWRSLAAACLAALVLESLWAAFLGRRRRVPR